MGWEEGESGGLVAVMPKYSLPARLAIREETVRQLQRTQRLMPFPHELLKVPQRSVGGSLASHY